MIKEIIYQTLEKNNKQWIPQHHNPSSSSFQYSDGRLVGKDMLELYLKWKGTAPSNPIEAPALLRMDLGNGAHDILAKILNKAGIKHISEVAGKAEVPGLKNKISYRVDGLVEINGELEVLEIKSSTDQALFGKGWGVEALGPKDEHKLQLLSYINLVPGVKRARLLYISRDSGRMLEYSYSGKAIGELTFSGVVERWAKLESLLQSNIQPDPEYKVWLNDSGDIQEIKMIKGEKFKSAWQWTYSSYKDLVWKNNYKNSLNYIFDTNGIDGIREYYARH